MDHRLAMRRLSVREIARGASVTHGAVIKALARCGDAEHGVAPRLRDEFEVTPEATAGSPSPPATAAGGSPPPACARLLLGAWRVGLAILNGQRRSGDGPSASYARRDCHLRSGGCVGRYAGPDDIGPRAERA